MKTLTYTCADLASILRTCADYVESTDNYSKMGYFNELVDMGIFADAIGKVVGSSDNAVRVITEY